MTAATPAGQATSGSRLFISMRIAASWPQPLQVRVLPRGARTGAWLMSPSWPGGNRSDKQPVALLAFAPVSVMQDRLRVQAFLRGVPEGRPPVGAGPARAAGAGRKGSNRSGFLHDANLG